MNKVLISVVGPTAIGKTSLSLDLAKYFNTEIISADSRQLFKELTIGTAVPSLSELKSVPHHFIQDRSIHHNYNVGAFEKEALNKLEGLFKKHDVVIMVGGSGLYIDAVCEGLDEFPIIDPNVRVELNRKHSESGLIDLQKLLKKLDPLTFSSIDKKNHRRVIRALEVCLTSGKPYSYYKNKPKAIRKFKVISVGLNTERPILYERINNRVDNMIAMGLLDEVKNLILFQNLPALNTVGYKELFKYLAGGWTLDEAIDEVKKNTRRFAKRQITWFRKNPDISWYDHTLSTNVIIKDLENKIIQK